MLELAQFEVFSAHSWTSPADHVERIMNILFLTQVRRAGDRAEPRGLRAEARRVRRVDRRRPGTATEEVAPARLRAPDEGEAYEARMRVLCSAVFIAFTVIVTTFTVMCTAFTVIDRLYNGCKEIQ